VTWAIASSRSSHFTHQHLRNRVRRPRSQRHLAAAAAAGRHGAPRGARAAAHPWYLRVSRPYLPTNLDSCWSSGWFWYSSLILTQAPSLKWPSPAWTHCSITCPSSCGRAHGSPSHGLPEPRLLPPKCRRAHCKRCDRTAHSAHATRRAARTSARSRTHAPPSHVSTFFTDLFTTVQPTTKQIQVCVEP
jgi:hypothetical protein